jgi:osmotically-inducible protein OsmY
VSQQDFRINAAVQNLLQRRWAGAAHLDFGTTNGVVYLRGSMPGAAVSDASPPALLRHIESEIRALPGVRDVVIGVGGWRKAGTEWVRTPSTSS